METPPGSRTLYVGTYTPTTLKISGTGSDDTPPNTPDGIWVLAFDPATGSLTPRSSIGGVVNPSFLCVRPQGDRLYSVEEVDKGRLVSFIVDPTDGSLTASSVERSEGSDPCYVTTDSQGRAVLVANYSSGTVALLPATGSGDVGAATTRQQHVGTGPNVERQEGPHAHCIVVDPTDSFAFSADLGADTIIGYKLDLTRGLLAQHSSVSLPAGAGPRHLVFHPTSNLAFVVNELNHTITSLDFDPDAGTLTPTSTVPTLPNNVSESVVRNGLVADVHVHPSGRFVYVSNRGHDSIAMYSCDSSTGKLTALGHRSTEGLVPRNFTIAPDGRFLLVANQDSGTIVVLELDTETGLLGQALSVVDVPRPVCLQFA